MSKIVHHRIGYRHPDGTVSQFTGQGKDAATARLDALAKMREELNINVNPLQHEYWFDKNRIVNIDHVTDRTIKQTGLNGATV